MNLKKSIFCVLLYLVVPFLLVSFYSCSDNPVNNNIDNQNEIDTNSKYDWTYQYTNGWLYGFYIADTANIFFAAEPTPLFYNGNEFKTLDLHDPHFICFGPTGYDKNTVYFGGRENYSLQYGPLAFKKWSNGNVNSYVITDDSLNNVNDMLIVGYDKLWISPGYNNRIYYFDNGTITTYYLSDTGITRGHFYKDKNQIIHLFKYKQDRKNGKNYLYHYEYQNDEFMRISIDSNILGQGHDGWFIGLFQCGDDLIMPSYIYTYYFDGNNWQILFDQRQIMPPFNIQINNMCGTSKDNLLIYSNGWGGNSSIFIYRDKKWSWERSIFYQTPPIRDFMNCFQIYKDRVYDDFSSTYYYSVLNKGKLKTNYKIKK
jgi:hypothetical protein